MQEWQDDYQRQSIQNQGWQASTPKFGAYWVQTPSPEDLGRWERFMKWQPRKRPMDGIAEAMVEFMQFRIFIATRAADWFAVAYWESQISAVRIANIAISDDDIETTLWSKRLEAQP